MAKFTYLIQMLAPAGVVQQVIEQTNDATVEMDITVASATDALVNVAFPYATIKAIALQCDIAATLKTNSSSAPSQTISLTAGVPNMWIYTGPGSNPITVDVTKIYVTTAAAGTLKIRVLYDPTP